jgi:hypothetical protein
MAELRFSELSTQRQAFIRQCQRMGFGKIFGLAVNDCEPVFGPQTELVVDLKLDSAEPCRPEVALSDFVLSAAMLRLFNRLDLIRNGSIELIEIRSGTPVHMHVRTLVQE